MITVNINDASVQLPRLLEQAMAGENIVFCKGNVPVVEMKSVPMQPVQSSKGERMLGNPPCDAKFSDDAFDPLPEEIWDMFNGRDDKYGR